MIPTTELTRLPAQPKPGGSRGRRQQRRCLHPGGWARRQANIVRSTRNRGVSPVDDIQYASPHRQPYLNQGHFPKHSETLCRIMAFTCRYR
jgi:hypothetical protein